MFLIISWRAEGWTVRRISPGSRRLLVCPFQPGLILSGLWLTIPQAPFVPMVEIQR